MSNADRNRPSYLPAGPLAVAGSIVYVSGELTGDVTLSADYPNICKLDPGGSNRDVTLDAEAVSKGLVRWIVNAASGAENLVVKDDGGSTIATLNQNEEGIFSCDGSSWILVRIATIALA